MRISNANNVPFRDAPSRLEDLQPLYLSFWNWESVNWNDDTHFSYEITTEDSQWLINEIEKTLEKGIVPILKILDPDDGYGLFLTVFETAYEESFAAGSNRGIFYFIINNQTISVEGTFLSGGNNIFNETQSLYSSLQSVRNTAIQTVVKYSISPIASSENLDFSSEQLWNNQSDAIVINYFLVNQTNSQHITPQSVSGIMLGNAKGISSQGNVGPKTGASATNFEPFQITIPAHPNDTYDLIIFYVLVPSNVMALEHQRAGAE